MTDHVDVTDKNSVLLKKRPIKERIEIFLAAHPERKVVPVHPDDYAKALLAYTNGDFGDIPTWKLRVLGQPEEVDVPEAS